MQAKVNKTIVDLVNVLEVVLNAITRLLCAYANFVIKDSMKADGPDSRRLRNALKIEMVIRPQGEDGAAATHCKFPVMGQLCRDMVCINQHRSRIIRCARHKALLRSHEALFAHNTRHCRPC